jgi:hypothetical protein
MFTIVTASWFPSPLKSPVAAGKIPKIAPPAKFRGGFKKPMLVGGGLGLFFRADVLATAARLFAAAGVELRWLSEPKVQRDANTTRTRRQTVRLFILIQTPFEVVFPLCFWISFAVHFNGWVSGGWIVWGFYPISGQKCSWNR